MISAAFNITVTILQSVYITLDDVPKFIGSMSHHVEIISKS